MVFCVCARLLAKSRAKFAGNVTETARELFRGRMAPKLSKPIKYSDDHSEVFGKGKSISAETKAVLAHVYENLRDSWKTEDGLWQKQRRRPNLEAEFKRLTGFGARTIERIKKEIIDTEHLSDPLPRGRKKRKLEEEDPCMYSWVSGKIEAAKHGGHVTLPSLLRAYQSEVDENVSLRQMRQALHRMGFRYRKRHGVYTSYRETARVQAKLRNFCEFVRSNTSQTTVCEVSNCVGFVSDLSVGAWFSHVRVSLNSKFICVRIGHKLEAAQN